ncbi:glycosyltransferase family 4 protein [Mycobacterium sp. SMC-4]|uniref:glycosyltransferase family 4 protein n=1 Tax=Mycobacterium sp. SMC-4 TaxID=2857059 RepID=UPI003D054D3D
MSPVSFFKGGAERSLFDLMENPSVHPVLFVTEEGPLSEAATQRGIETCIVPFGRVSAIRRPFRVTSAFPVLSDWIRAARLLARVSADHGVVLVHSNGLKAHAVAILSSRLGGPPVVSHIRDIGYTGVEHRVWRGLARFSAQTILVSRACWPDMHLPENVTVIFNSVGSMDVQAQPPKSLKQETVIGICGRIHPNKGIHLALDWVAAARERGYELKLIIRGAAAPEDAEYEQLLQTQIQKLNLSEHVKFDGFRDELVEIYAGLDAVLVPSVIPDPLPRSVMEAFALGLPVIGYPAGGIVEMIEPGKNGWLADSSDAFCSAVGNICALGPDGLALLKARTSATVQQRFSRTRMFAQLNAVYRRALGFSADISSDSRTR